MPPLVLDWLSLGYFLLYFWICLAHFSTNVFSWNLHYIQSRNEKKNLCFYFTFKKHTEANETSLKKWSWHRWATGKEKLTGPFVVCELKNYLSKYWFLSANKIKCSEINLLRKFTDHHFLFSFLVLERVKEFIMWQNSGFHQSEFI